ncbi:MAG TPA: glycosyltransferase, partial [Pseudobdellovibrionaceae bacterium]|nr:glycosyltransferase [Pseudobdellovibrionaceae bacterium]
MKISLVLATYGRSEVLEVFLNSIVGCAYDSFEVLIMDQNPDDRLSVIVDKYIGIGLNIRHVRLPRPGLVEAR